MDRLTDMFSKILLNNPNKDITTCYNWMLDQVSDEDADIITKHVMLFIRIGEVVRSENPDIISKLYANI